MEKPLKEEPLKEEPLKEEPLKEELDKLNQSLAAEKNTVRKERRERKDLEQLNQGLAAEKKQLQDSLFMHKRSEQKLAIRLDASLYAMVLMQAQIRHMQAEKEQDYVHLAG